VLKGRPVYLIKSMPDGGGSPGVFDVATRCHIFGMEVARTLWGLKDVSGASHAWAGYRAGAYWANCVLARYGVAHGWHRCFATRPWPLNSVDGSP
jgi:hypothetical protein